MRIALVLVGLVLAMFVVGCAGIPKGVQPVTGFNLDRYLGKWYEIARLDHSFERGLTDVSAEYSMREDGGVKVMNSGFSKAKGKRTQAEGRAYFVKDKATGHLKVSFFGPFYGSYVIFELDDDYQYSFVTSSNTSYLWLLARTPEVSDEVLELFKKRSKELGYSIDELIYPQTED